MFVIDAFGARWTLDVSELAPSLGAELLRLWERARADGAEPAPTPDDAPAFVVRRTVEGRVEIDGVPHLLVDADLPYAVSRALTAASIHRRSGQCLLLHAAGVATDDGGTVALVAGSGTGKTTASRVLGQSLGYVTDETVCVEHDLRVLAYPKPLSVVVDPEAPRGKRESSPDELGLVRAPAALTLSCTVLLRRSPDVTSPVLEPISLVDAMAEVLPQTSALPSLDRPLDRLAVALTTGHGPWRLTYRDVADCVDLVADLAHRRFPDGPPHEVTWTWVDGHEGLAAEEAARPETTQPEAAQAEAAPHDAAVAARGDATTWTRAPFRDAVVSDGSALVMLDRVPITLPGLAATVWLAAGDPVGLADLVDAATASHGPHPDAEAVVTGTVATLVAQGLLRTGARA